MVDKDDVSLLPCERCGVDMHRSSLLRLMRIEDDEGLTKEQVKKIVNPFGLTIHVCSDCNGFLKMADVTTQSKVNQSAAKMIGGIVTHVTGKDDEEEDPSKINDENKKQSSAGQSQKGEASKKAGNEDLGGNDCDIADKKMEVCRHYKRGKCKHGRKGEACDYSHPKPCRKFMEHGNRSPRGCQGNCKSFHPRMCSRSLKKGECLNDDCTFAHVKGTKRKKDNNREKAPGEQRKIDHLDKNELPCKDHADKGKDDFLYLLHDFKTKIMETMDNKLNTMMTTLMTPRAYQQFPLQMPMPMPMSWMGMQLPPMPIKN